MVPSRDPTNLSNAKNLEGCGETARKVTLPNSVGNFKGTFILLQRRISRFSDSGKWLKSHFNEFASLVKVQKAVRQAHRMQPV